MGHTQPAVVCYLRTMSYIATGMLSVQQASLCSAHESSFGQHTFNKIQTPWKKPGGEKQEQPQVQKTPSGKKLDWFSLKKIERRGEDTTVIDTRGCRHLFRMSPDSGTKANRLTQQCGESGLDVCKPSSREGGCSGRDGPRKGSHLPRGGLHAAATGCLNMGRLFN